MILIGSENPDGYKLEELLDTLKSEIDHKCKKISDDQRAEAKTVLANNQKIIWLLERAASLQRQSMMILDGMGENHGPLGTPRIGGEQRD